MSNVYLVFISIYFDNARKMCDNLQGESFSALSQLNEKLREELEGETHADEDWLVYSIEDFTEAVNRAEMDIITEYYSAYITIG
jgi:hypothetical protein